MPLLKIQTNKPLTDQQRQQFLKQASRSVAQALNKPEQYMMVSLETDRAMMFAGSTEPAAFAELKAIGLPADRTGELSRFKIIKQEAVGQGVRRIRAVLVDA